MDSLPTRLSQATPVNVNGVWQRHVAARFAATALTGRSAEGRWGTEGSYPVLYLGKPTDSVAVEAYRHLVDPVVVDDGPTPPIAPRALITCEVAVTEILDLRTAATRVQAGLTLAQLQSETSDTAAYAACQNVSAAAHQLGYHGIITPSATKVGETLVLFSDLLAAAEQPQLSATEMWLQLPPDPRQPGQRPSLRIVK
jgi:RES domain-containing protein